MCTTYRTWLRLSHVVYISEQSNGTRTNESCLWHERVVPHTQMSHVSHIRVTRFMSHTWTPRTSHARTHVCCTFIQVSLLSRTHLYMSDSFHVTHVNTTHVPRANSFVLHIHTSLLSRTHLYMSDSIHVTHVNTTHVSFHVNASLFWLKEKSLIQVSFHVNISLFSLETSLIHNSFPIHVSFRLNTRLFSLEYTSLFTRDVSYTCLFSNTRLFSLEYKPLSTFI